MAIILIQMDLSHLTFVVSGLSFLPPLTDSNLLLRGLPSGSKLVVTEWVVGDILCC